jgi:type II secretory pathway component GspD/PulD (secretin)
MQRPMMIRSISTRVLVAASLTAAAGAPVSVAGVGANGVQPVPPTDPTNLNAAPAQAAPNQPVENGAAPQPAPTPAPAPAPQPEAPAPQPAPVQPAPAPVLAPVSAPEPAPSAAVTQPVQEPPKAPLIKFSFKDMPFDLVLDYFSRESGLPIIREAPVPAGAMTFVGSEPYSFEDALSILNLNLAMQGVHLRRQDQYLYLATLADSVKKANRVENDAVPSDVKPDQYLTLTIPLLNAQAALVAEQIKPLIGPYGGVQAVPAQNMVIVMESAAQCRRIREIIQAIDQVKPADQAFKLFPLKYAQADAIFTALRGLIGERVRQTFIGADGKATTVTDTAVQGVNITPDPRTNSLLVVGLASRIKQVEELLTLLDIPEAGQGESQMMTFTLATLSADAAAQRVNALFQSVPANRKPTVLPLPEAGKLTVIGAQPFLLQAMTLLGEVDGGGLTAQQVEKSIERKAVVAKLKFVTPTQVEQIATRLMTPRQAQVVRMAPTPDGRGLVITGPGSDVDSVQEVVRGMDVAPDVEREARMVKIAAADPAALIATVQDLYAKTGQSEKEPITVTLDAESRIATLIGSRDGLLRFESLITSAQSNIAVDRTGKSYDIRKVKPSQLAAKLARLARPMLMLDDSTPYAEPVFEPLDELRKLIVRAEPSQFAVIDELIKRLDTDEPRSRELRVVKVTTTDPAGLIERAQKLYAAKIDGLTEEEAGPVEAKFDEKSGRVMISGRAAAIRMFSDSLTDAQQLTPPARTTRIIDITNQKAGDLIEPLELFLKNADSIDPARKVPDPTLRAIERTNSLLVTAEDAQHALISDYILRLDKVDQSQLPPLKLLQLRTAESAAIASMLTQQYAQRPQAERASKPVEIRADAATNTLIVSAHPDLFDSIKGFVEELNKERKEGADRVTKLFPLKVAKAVEVAAAMDKLYPLPPVPVDRLNRPMPWLQQPKEVTVSADSSSNSLIVDCPADRVDAIEALAQQLDRVELPPSAELRTYRVVGADLNTISTTLNALASRGNLAAPAQPGKQAVQVIVQTEPRSGTLIVAGDDVTFERVEQMLKDLSAVPIERGLRVIPIANERASAVRERSLAIYNAQIAQIPGANAVDITIDEKSNSLMVVGDSEAMPRYMQIIDELQRQAGPAREVRMIELKLAKANEVAVFLDDLIKSSESLGIRGGPEPVIEPIEANNTLLVAAQPIQFAVIESLVRSLDQAKAADKPPMRILKVRTSDAANLATILQQAYSVRSPEQQGKFPVDIQADAATNTLLVSAHPEILPEIEQIVGELNETSTSDVNGREIRIFPLKIARAEELAQTIDQMFPDPPIPLDPRTRQPRPDLKTPREVVVRADRATNSLIVDAPAKRLSGFEQIVKSLDQQKLAENVEIRTYKLVRADLAAVAAALQSLAANGSLAGGAPIPAGSINISTEPTNRAVIVSGPATIFTGVENVLKELDGAGDRAQTSMRMYGLKHARADRLKALLEKVLTTRLREQQQADGKNAEAAISLLDVSADTASNTLIISAPEAIQKIAEELVKSLDVEGSASGQTTVRVVPLSFAEAGLVAATLMQAIPGLDLPTGGKVNVVAAPGSNAILLTGIEIDLNKVEGLIKPLDVQPSTADAPKVETFVLKHADAEQLAQTVQRLLVDQQETDPRILSLQLQWARQNRQEMFKKPTIRVESAQRTNSLIISAPQSTLQLAKTLIENLDQPSGQTDRVVMTFTPARAEPQQLISTVGKIVNATLPQGRGPLELTHESRSGAIVAIGSKEQVAEAMKRLAEFDDRVPAVPGVDLKVIDLANADAKSIASQVQGMLSDRTRWPLELIQAETGGVAVATPTVNADPKSNRLLVSVPSVLMPMATELITTLDKPAGDSAVQVQVFKLQQGEATSVATALRDGLKAAAKAGDPVPTVTPEPGSNVVIVAGTSAQLAQVSDLIKPMDTVVEPDRIGLRTIFLKHARAEAVAPVIEGVLARESMFDRMSEPQRQQYIRMHGIKAIEKVKVTAETRLNALLVSGPAPMLELAEQVVGELDIDSQGGAGRRMVRIITLENADATELAANVTAVFAEDASQVQPPSLRVDRSSNSLIIRATGEQMQTVEELVSKLDKATLATSRQMRVVPIDKSRASAELMARTLKRLVEQQGGVKVEVISTEELLKRTTAPESEKAKPSDDDAPRDPPPSGGAPKPGGKGSPSANSTTPAQWLAIAAAWNAMGSLQPVEPGQSVLSSIADGDASITIAVDPATNSLLLVGSPRATERLAALIAELEKQLPAEPTGVHVVTLPENVVAQQVQQIVASTVTQIGRMGPANPAGFSGAVSVMADPTGSSLIVLANDTDFATVGQIIASVSQAGGTAKLAVKIYPLQSISAQRAREAIEDLVSPQPRGPQARRVRAIDLTIPGEGGQGISATIDPSKVRLTADASGSLLIVAAPDDAMPLIDRFVGLIDQSPVTSRLAIRRYELANARSTDLARTLQTLMDAQRQGVGSNELPAARFIADERTNALLVTAAEAQHAEVKRILETADASTEDKSLETRIIALQQAAPATVQKIVEEVVIGGDPARKEKIRLSTDESSNLFVVRANPETIKEVERIVAEVDSTATAGLPVRSIKLERADAQQVATALQKFFLDRAAAAAKPGQRQQNKVTVVGDRRSATLVVAASDEDFAQIKTLAADFDTPAPGRDLQFKIIALKNARISDIQATVRNLADELQWQRSNSGPRNQDQGAETLSVDFNEGTNSVVVMGQGDGIVAVEKLIAALDVPDASRVAMVVRSVVVQHADATAIRQALEKAMANPAWRPWRGQDPEGVTVISDQRKRSLVIVGKTERVEQAVSYIQQLDTASERGGQQVATITLEHARADRAAASVSQFMRGWATSQGRPAEALPSVIGSPEGNVLIVSGDETELKTIRDVVAQIDQPGLNQGRRIEVYLLRNAPAPDTATTLRSVLTRGRSGEEQATVTTQPSTNSVIVSAPDAMFDQIEALVKTLDAPPTADTSNLVTVPLQTARAQDVAAALKSALPVGLKLTVTPVTRSNTLLLSGSTDAINVVMDHIKKLDQEPARTLEVFRRITVTSVPADEIEYTLSQMLRARARNSGDVAPTIDSSRSDNSLLVSAPADQIEEIESMIKALDVPASKTRRTEFVKVEFADAEQVSKALQMFYGRFAPEASTPGARNVTIVPDRGSNSIIISADEAEWAGLKELVRKLDDKNYDTSRQLAVIPLSHADATSVARAINEGFRVPLQDAVNRARQDRTGRQNNERFTTTDGIVLEGENVPAVSAEAQTNALVVFAVQRDLERIQDVVRQLDVPGFTNLPEPRIIPVTGGGRPSLIAQTLREMFTGQRGAQNNQTTGPRAIMIAGLDDSAAILVRADETQFAQIKALADTLQQQGKVNQLSPTVVKLSHVPAARLRATLVATFTPIAQKLGETVAIEVDRGSNALVIASSERLQGEIRRVITELDQPVLGDAEAGEAGPTRLGQSVFIVDITNNSPEDVRKVLMEMGVDKAQAADRPGVVTEPVTITALSSRRALAVLASPGDSAAIIDLIKAVDATPMEPDQHMAVVGLKLATAQTVVATLNQMLSPEGQAAGTGPSRALSEQIRRLSLARNGVDQKALTVDLSRPIRLIPDTESNSVVIASSVSNVEAVKEVVKLLDALPMGDAVVVRIFPLQNAMATRTKVIVDQLFAQGEALRRLPGTRRQGLPTTATGQALAGEIATAVDDRTNTLICAGRDEAVAFVEVLVKQIDSDEATKWIEPSIIPLVHADSVALARKLREVLVSGASVTPEAMGLQRQFGRLRMIAKGGEPSTPESRIEADLFAPLTGLVITPDEELNALIVVGTPTNLEVVRELVKQLDVEAAAASNEVRVFALQNAAADRVSQIVQGVFQQREREGQIRAEDRLIVAADVRTNSLIVTSSPRSFAILESLLKTLDGAQTNFSVGLHVIPVTDSDVRVLAPKIEKLMRERIEASKRSGSVANPSDVFSIEAEPTSNLLIVAASEENLQLVRELLTALAGDASKYAASARTELIGLTRATATDAAQSDQCQMYAERENQRRVAPGSVTVIANERLNALIVSGNEQDIAEIRGLVAQLENAQVIAAIRSRSSGIELRSANASEMVNLLENLLAGRPVGAVASGRQAGDPRLVPPRCARQQRWKQGGHTPTEAEIDGAIRDQVTLTPDLRSNSVLVNAPPEILRAHRGDRRGHRGHQRGCDARSRSSSSRTPTRGRWQSCSRTPSASAAGQRVHPDPAAHGRDDGRTTTARRRGRARWSSASLPLKARPSRPVPDERSSWRSRSIRAPTR